MKSGTSRGAESRIPHVRAMVILALTLALATPLFSQVFMDADSTGDAYARILSKGYGYEVPDCVHPIRHITEEWDGYLRKYVFEFSAHKSIDNDRCINFDRQRIEIKTWNSSPDSMKGFFGETVTFRWKFKLDAGFQPSANFTHIHQIKPGDGTYDTDMPLITITAVKSSTNKLEIRFTAPIQEGGNTIRLTTTTLAPFLGEWVEAYESVRYDSNSHGAYSLQIKRLSDDSPLLSCSDSTLSMWRRGITFNRPKYGIYRSLLDSNSLRDESVRFADFYLKKGTTFTLPSAPGGVNASAVSGSQVNLSWIDNSNNEGQFRIDRSYNGTTWLYLATAPAGSTSYPDTGLADLTSYYYRVRAENTYGNSQYSDTAGATTQGTSLTSTGSGNWSSTTPNAPWPGGVVPTLADNVTIRATDSVTVDIGSASCSNLIVNGAILTSKAVAIGLTVHGSITVNPNGVFKAQSTNTGVGDLVHSLTVHGNITHSGVVWDFRVGSTGTNLGAWNTNLVGTDNSTVTIGGAYSSTNGDFNAITINKTAPGKVFLGSDININGGSGANPSAQSVLTFVNGIVETGNFTLIHQSGTSTNIIGASDSSYVLGAMGRGMSNSVGSTKDFPVGDASGYRPFNLRSTTAGGATGHFATVRLINADANTGSSVLNGGIDRVSAVRYYKVTYTQGAGASSMSFDRFYPSYGTDDGVAVGNTDLRVACSIDHRTTWTKLGQIKYPHTTDLSSPPTQIKPDSLSPSLVLTSDVNAVYITLADTLGGANPLGANVQYTVMATAGVHGTINPSGAVTVILGADQTFTITPASGYQVDSLLVDNAIVDSTTSYTFTDVTANHAIRGVFRPSTTTLGVSIASGWNLISNPVTNPIPGDSVRQLYPTSLNLYAFEFSGGYVQSYIMGNGKGYWEKFSGAISQSITGTPRTVDTISVVSGWNIVGSISCSVDTGTIVSIPPGLRTSNWFKYAAGYSPATQLTSGGGYWVKANGSGAFAFACPALGAPKAQTPEVGIGDVLNSVTIIDSKGGSQTLYFGADDEKTIPVSLYAMPPIPPVGAFDARFETADGGSMIQTHPAKISGVVEFPLSIQSDAYPLTITWNINKGTASYELTDGIGGRVFPSKSMTGGGTLTIASSAVTRFLVKLVEDGQLPKEFSLSQNYPNPFNPATTVTYTLPVDSKVTLDIYNVLGQCVSTLVRENRKAGNYNVEWNGTTSTGVPAGTGVYFVRLSATGNSGASYSEVRKLVMLK